MPDVSETVVLVFKLLLPTYHQLVPTVPKTRRVKPKDRTSLTLEATNYLLHLILNSLRLRVHWIFGNRKLANRPACGFHKVLLKMAVL